MNPSFPTSSSHYWLNALIQNIETGETISTSALYNFGWDCPKKTTTTTTTTAIPIPQCEDFKMSGKEYKWSCSKDLYVGSVCLLECKYKQNDNNQVDGLQVKCNEEENCM